MSVEFSDGDGLGGSRKELADAITEYIENNGPATTPQLVDELYGGFGYSTKQSFQRTLSDLREVMEERGMISCERVDSAGSRKTWRWSQ